jgi:hypothetical protein
VSSWEPGRRQTARELEQPYEGVPAHLRGHLWRWIDTSFKKGDYYEPVRFMKFAMHMRIELSADDYSKALTQVRMLCGDEGFMLDTVEALLELNGDYLGRARLLDKMLEDTNSLYTVKDDYTGLEKRDIPEVKEQVQAVVNVAGAAGSFLMEAWNAAYGRVHNAPYSYGRSVKAVETALASKITPQNAKQTLGTMITDVRNAPQNFEFVVPDGDNSNGVETVVNMMRQLWEGQSRHGGARPKRDETLEEAQAAVHLAATLVQYGISGAFKRKEIGGQSAVEEPRPRREHVPVGIHSSGWAGRASHRVKSRVQGRGRRKSADPRNGRARSGRCVPNDTGRGQAVAPESDPAAAILLEIGSSTAISSSSSCGSKASYGRRLGCRGLPDLGNVVGDRFGEVEKAACDRLPVIHQRFSRSPGRALMGVVPGRFATRSASSPGCPTARSR